jgi:hypothetical protein
LLAGNPAWEELTWQCAWAAALDLARDSGLTLAATERARALILDVFENKRG